MAGIYIHIPFCKTLCNYCDFYKTTNKSDENEFVNAAVKEIISKKNFIGHDNIETIYFGGGTPSFLNIDNIKTVLSTIEEHYKLDANNEITLEANPDDLTKDYLTHLRENTIVNRLSIGIQSFNDKTLTLLNRRHSAKQAHLAIENALQTGFTNLTTDLIYGIPGLSNALWENSIDTMLNYDIKHLSAYHLSIEKDTRFHKMLLTGNLKEVDDTTSIYHYNLLIDKTRNNSFNHYEVSNFCKEGFYSRHNSNYWNGTPYLGIGPSAHSFNGKERRWNIANTEQYILGVNENSQYFEIESINTKTAYNEYIMTRLRTSEGISLSEINNKFGAEYTSYFEKELEKLKNSYDIIDNDNSIRLSSDSMFLSDAITSQLMKV